MKGMGPSLLLEEDKTGNKVLFQFDVIFQTVDNFIELNTCNCSVCLNIIFDYN